MSEFNKPYEDDRMTLARQYLAELYDLPLAAVVPEFFDFLKIVSNGAKKYAMNNWLDPKGHSSGHTDMYDKMGHHWARGFAGELYDKESGEHTLLHLQCRAAMRYTRDKRGIKDE